MSSAVELKFWDTSLTLLNDWLKIFTPKAFWYKSKSSPPLTLKFCLLVDVLPISNTWSWKIVPFIDIEKLVSVSLFNISYNDFEL